MFMPLRQLLDGPAPVLPTFLDRWSERWWAARPRTRTAICLTLTLLTLVLVSGRVAANSYGPEVEVLLATRDLEVGQRVDASDVTVSAWPQRLLPSGALSNIPVDQHLYVISAVPAGQPMTTHHAATQGLRELIPSGMAAVPINSESLPAVPVGSVIDLVARDFDGRGLVAASESLVLLEQADVVWVAVRPVEAPHVAAAAAAGTLSVVLR